MRSRKLEVITKQDLFEQRNRQSGLEIDMYMCVDCEFAMSCKSAFIVATKCIKNENRAKDIAKRIKQRKQQKA